VNDERLKAECGIAAHFLFGCSALEFYRQLPQVCNWLEGIPAGHLRRLASDCSWADSEESLGALLLGRRDTGGPPFKMVSESLQMAARGPGGVTVRIELDYAADAGYIGFSSGAYRRARRTDTLSDRINLDYDGDGELLGIELLGIS
jgi:uncharacterized protein YuzE